LGRTIAQVLASKTSAAPAPGARSQTNTQQRQQMSFRYNGQQIHQQEQQNKTKQNKS
jgi:hypothetical protein